MQVINGAHEIDDLIAFFKRCIVGLKPHGLIGVKENISTAADYVVDEEDSSVTRYCI